jgi:APA family basic amino acid/polyamine antiporter
MFGRVKPLDAILATAEKKSLHRSLGAFQLTMLGVGAVIGTGIFVLTAEAAQKAGPGMMVSFVIAGFVCAVAALCYAEMASMVPVSGSAYTYSYAVMGELVAWMVGWALILEYAIAAGAVSVGWSGYMVGFVQNSLHITVPLELVRGPFDGGLVNLPAMAIAVVITGLLILGTKESATVNAILVAIKIVALSLFVALTVPMLKTGNFQPFAPQGFVGISGAAASIFFAYVGFDAVSTAAEETKNPQRNMPIGLIGSLAICTVFYMLVAAGVIGTVGAQPVYGPGHEVLARLARAVAGLQRHWRQRRGLLEGSPGLDAAFGRLSVHRLAGWPGRDPCAALGHPDDDVRPDPHLLRDEPRWPAARVLLQGASALPHPHVITLMTGVFVALFAAFFPVGLLADVSNSGTLFAFAAVSVAVLVLRRTDPARVRPFRTPLVTVIAPISILGCLYLFGSLSAETMELFVGWAVLGLFVYYGYSRSRSHVGRGLVEVHEIDADVPPGSVPPIS